MNKTWKKVYYDFKEGATEAASSDTTYLITGTYATMAGLGTKKVGSALSVGAYILGAQMIFRGAANAFIKNVMPATRSKEE